MSSTITRSVRFERIIKQGKTKTGSLYCLFRVRSLDGFWKVNCYGFDVKTVNVQAMDAELRITTKIWPSANSETVRASEVRADDGDVRTAIERKYGSVANYNKQLRAMQKSEQQLSALTRLNYLEDTGLLPKRRLD